MDIPPLSAILLSLTTGLASYLAFLCFTPPNPSPIFTNPSEAPHDTLSLSYLNSPYLFIRRYLVLSLGLYQSYLIFTLAPSSPRTTLCPHPENLYEGLFTWSWYSGIFLCAILVAAPVRLRAFKELGENFTFRLAKPKKLVKTGLYAYVQHPSYTTNFMVILSTIALLFRPDSSISCLLPPSLVTGYTLFGHGKWYALTSWRLITFFVLYIGRSLAKSRITDEEAMLKKEFGREWEEWSARTPRFVPGWRW